MTPRRTEIAIAFAMFAALISIGAIVWRATAHATTVNAQALEGMADRPIGDWVPTEASGPVVDASPLDAEGRPVNVYDHVVYRNYQRSDGTTLTLVLAYLNQQEVRSGVHRPEGCYTSLGYALSERGQAELAVDGRGVPLRTFVATSTRREETVAYWVRIGRTVDPSILSGRREALSQALHHRLPDAMLVRASIVRNPGEPHDTARTTAALTDFLQHFLAATPADRRPILIG